MLKVFYTDQALQDLDEIGVWELQEFGIEAVDRYALLIDHSVEKLRANPEESGVQPTLKGLSKYHLSMCKKEVMHEGITVKEPRHLIFFKVVEDTLYVTRILRDNRDIIQHL